MKKDFQEKNLKNPFYRKKKAKRYCLLTIVFVGIIFFLTALIYIIYFSPLFLIKNIEVGREDIRNYVSEEIVNSNLIKLKKREVENNLIDKYQLKEVVVSKIFPNGLKIAIIERQPYFLLRVNDDLEFRDKNACSIPSQDFQNEGDFPVIIKEGLELDNPKKCLDIKTSLLDKILLIFQLSKNKEIELSHFEIDLNNNLKLVLKEGALVYFSLREDIDKQLFKLEQVYFKKLEDLKSINYIDVRYGDRAFINYK